MNIPDYKKSGLPVAVRVEDLLSRMTVGEKVGQLCQTPMRHYDKRREEHLAAVREGRFGSRILADTAWAGNAPGEIVDPVQLNEIQRAAVEESRLGIPLIIARDVIYGQQTVLPIPLAQAASWNPGLVEQAYRCIATEAASLGIHWTFAPMLDIVRDPRWGRVIESSGEDPYLTSQFAGAVVRGFQGQDLAATSSLLACAKHFVGYGAAEGGRDYDTTEITTNTLHNVYLPPFKAAVEQGVATLMSGFNDLGGTPVTGSQELIQGWLKTDQQFDGMVVSDWGSISDLSYFGVADDLAESAVQGLNAGVDMAMTYEVYDDNLARLLEQGRIDIERLDDAVSRVLTAKFKAGLFERPYVDERWHKTALRAEVHVEKALELAEQCIVMLKNRGQLLPLPKQGLKLAVLGPHAHSRRQHLGPWCLDGKAEDVTSIFAGITAAAPELEVITESAVFSDEMVEQAHRADVVVLCVGESHRRTGEARNVAELALPAGQEELIEAIGKIGKPLIVVQCTGRPLPSPSAEQYADALLYSWQLGTEVGKALGRILFGDISPSGKLPISVPRSTGQVPIYYCRKPIGKMRAFQDYMSYKDQQDTPLYPFGYGLSYTNFAYSDLWVEQPVITGVENQIVSVTVTNTGQVEASEIVQCYIRQHVARTTRPSRELKGFRRIHLAPGESCQVSFKLTAMELGYYTENGDMVLSDSKIDVFVGESSQTQYSTHFYLSVQ
ncbi:glycoside hydrolase family 3 N-terminal domain-containing protein [Photobacterium sp. DA100]|uniref:glycoside hydrolase family 3 N-terminal domain-containing protein n=1 Tax=Photobacterium sp. DA100 TaxID=3027472 RepID=UPI00247A08C7|nr:glycoside hydrolase family 3 N-terminal domain-containing protein [Photobacterium sp. DA100]WEM41170.1 glycoside hydrolase family 3 N-terminal domain-containing protein [Photobacterium sp. DA100]